MLTLGTVSSARHYDEVVSAWSILLGSNLHYGYFETGEETLDEATACLTERMLDLPGALGPSARVLDVGCGTGRPAVRMARRFGCTVVGISPSQACVRGARDAMPKDVVRPIDFQVGDAQALQFGDQSFDVAWAIESSHLILDKPRLFSEARRVLKPGGCLALCDIVVQAELGMEDVIARRDDFLLLNQVFGRAMMKTPRYYAEEAARHGFVVDTRADITSQTAPTFDRWKRNASVFRDEVVGRFGEPSWKAFDDSIAVLKRFWEEGVLGYFMMAARRE